ncbi:artemin [Zootoca vivipara]|uniref:artemin n=1 Tax=Zootoca vivipara TaxID=8524 RepID=UPI00293BB4C4|nr:artemin [Zootoca vivipara]
MEPVLFSLPEAACPGARPAAGPLPEGREPRRLPASPCAVSPARRGGGSRDRGCPADSGPDASRSNPIFPRRGALSPPGTCRPCRRRERRAPEGAIPAGPDYGPRGRVSAGAAEEPLPPPGGSGFDALEGPVPEGRGRRFPARILGVWSPESRAQQEAPHLPRRSARMEWRVEGPRHRSDRSPSAYRSLPVRQERYRERGLWGTITLLSLFAGAVMATPQTWHNNQTLGAAPDGSMGTASSAPLEENSREASSLGTWSHWHGGNVTIDRLSSSELLRAERSPAGSSKAKKGSKKAGRSKNSRYCRLHSRLVKVRDLGLGFESEEIVPFKYCSGSCQRARTNYDLALSSLLQQRTIVPGPHDHPSSHPCCRPTRYEDFSFMNVRNAWQTVDRISAAECGCVG